MVGQTWRRRRIWWPELVVEVLSLDNFPTLIHMFHTKIRIMLESV